MANSDEKKPSNRRGRPATTDEEREKQLRMKAFDLAEKQLDAGTASSQVISMLLKGGGVREKLEMEKLENENRLLNARIEGLEAATRIEASIEAAIDVFRIYRGEEPPELHD